MLTRIISDYLAHSPFMADPNVEVVGDEVVVGAANPKDLPLAVPGLEVLGVDGEWHRWFLRKPYKRCRCRWSRQSMEARYQQLFDAYGAADPRRAFMTCRGPLREPQMRLPGLVVLEARVRSGGLVSVSYTPYGLMLIDSAFCTRIQYPDQGGVDTVPFYTEKVEVGSEWWFVGSQGDSPDILALEIEGSPLGQRTKENLLENLASARGEPRRASS